MTATPVDRLARGPAAASALAWPGGNMNYGQLHERVTALAGVAARRGAPGSPLAIVAGSRLHTVLGVLSALRLGRPALPLDPARPDLADCLAACSPGGTLTDAELAHPVSATSPPARLGEVTAASRIALLVPTSGTGGATRVAMLSGAALDAHVAASAAVLPPLGPGDRWLACLPMTSIGALAALWRALSSGACFAFLEHFDVPAARQLLAGGTTHVSVVPAMLEPLAKGTGPAPGALRCVLSGGGRLSMDAARPALAQGWPLWNGWGMTETASHVTLARVDAEWREGIVGRPLPGVALAVDAASGRLAIAAPTLMSGYASPSLAPGAGLETDGRFLSSDCGELLPDSRLRLLGRVDDVIVTGGVNVDPQAVEDMLSACPGAGEVAVTARPDARWGMVLVALYTGAGPGEALEAWARQRLPSAWRPREFRRVAALPRNAMGKLIRPALAGLRD